MNSNYGKLNEEETMDQLDGVMEIEKPTTKLDNAIVEEVASRHSFY
jgi:hypothetical protein